MPSFFQPTTMTLSEAIQLQRWKGGKFISELEKKSNLMRLLPWYPTSDGDIHKGTRAVSLPTGSFGAINKGVKTGQVATAEYTETVKLYELKSDVDERLLDGRSKEQAARIRANRDRAYLKGFMNGLADEVINNPGTDADAAKGLLSRRPKTDGKYTFSLGGTGANLGSILFIRPGEDGVCLRYPDAGAPSFVLRDVGTVQALELDNSGKPTGLTYPAKETLMRVYYTPDVEDDSALIRIANVPTNTKLTSTNIESIIDIVNSYMPNGGQGYVAFAPKEVISQFWKYLNDKNNISFTKQEVEGMGAPVCLFNVPLFYEDFMSSIEAQIA